MQRLARRRAKKLPIGVCDLVIGLPLGVLRPFFSAGESGEG